MEVEDNVRRGRGFHSACLPGYKCDRRRAPHVETPPHDHRELARKGSAKKSAKFTLEHSSRRRRDQYRSYEVWRQAVPTALRIPLILAVVRVREQPHTLRLSVACRPSECGRVPKIYRTSRAGQLQNVVTHFRVGWSRVLLETRRRRHPCPLLTTALPTSHPSSGHEYVRRPAVTVCPAYHCTREGHRSPISRTDSLLR